MAEMLVSTGVCECGTELDIRKLFECDCGITWFPARDGDLEELQRIVADERKAKKKEGKK